MLPQQARLRPQELSYEAGRLERRPTSVGPPFGRFKAQVCGDWVTDGQ